jgi:hypothetical protein
MPNVVNIQEYSQSYYLVQQWKDSIRRIIMFLAILLSSLMVIWEPMKRIVSAHLNNSTSICKQMLEKTEGTIMNGKYKGDTWDNHDKIQNKDTQKTIQS